MVIPLPGVYIFTEIQRVIGKLSCTRENCYMQNCVITNNVIKRFLFFTDHKYHLVDFALRLLKWDYQWAVSTKKVLLNMLKMHRFRSSCTCNTWAFALQSYILLYPVILLVDSEGLNQTEGLGLCCLHMSRRHIFTC